MKIRLLASVAALCCFACFTPRADAWSNWKFGVGLNVDYKGGGNNLLWGLKKSEQPPAPGYAGYPAAPYAAPLGGQAGYPIGTDPNNGATGYNPNPDSSAPAAPFNRAQPVGYWNGQTGYQPQTYFPYYGYGYGYANYQNPSPAYGR